LKIVVLAGGTSMERDVSLSTGKMIYEALRKRGHQVVLLDVYLGYCGEAKEDIFEMEMDWIRGISQIGEDEPDIEKVKSMRKEGEKGYFGPKVLPICQMSDLVFLALHGENGENGKIQAAFDLYEIPYTGTGYVSSALSMNKDLSKILFQFGGIQTPSWFLLKRGERRREPGFPAVVKTCCGGSSVGVYIVNNKEEYEAALQAAYTYEEKVIVEEFIKGRECSVGVIDKKALPIIEMEPKEGFYDYKNKYQDGNTVETCPADFPADLTKKIQEIAEKVFEILQLETYARMDFRIREDGEIFCLEANTLPGMTPISLLPQEAAAIGIDFGELCEKIIEVSLKKYKK
jgi:D-alanine-D-alanine ligase